MHIAGSDYTLLEERLHAWTHGFGAFLSLGGLAWMLTISVDAGDPWRIVASSIYGLSMFVLFVASTLYHSARDEQRRQFFKLLDHCAIYLLIAGTYTPFLLVAMRSGLGWFLFVAVWCLAAVGIVLKILFRHRFPRISLAGYLLMGWLVVVAAPQVAGAVGGDGMMWLVAGGLCYTLGAAFYALSRIALNHVIWHLFVLAGGACHFLAVVWYVLPAQI